MRQLLINYATDDMKDYQYRNRDTGLRNGFRECICYGPLDIDEDFYNRNKSILDEKKGAGYFLWKPYIILKTLEILEYGDVVYYSDSRIDFIDDVTPLLDLAIYEDIVIFSNKLYINKNWCKRDAFYYMDCNDEKYYEGEHIQASFIIIRKTDRSLEFMREFLRYGEDRRIITEDKDVCGLSRLDVYNENRYDQTILSLLSMKWDIKPHRDPSQIGLKNREYFSDSYGQIVNHHRGRRVNLLMNEYRMGNIEDSQGGRNRLMGLRRLIEENLSNDSIVCEIGSYEGKSSELFALICGRVYCIDPWEDVWTKEGDKNVLILEAERMFDMMMLNYNNINKVKKISKDACNDFGDGFFDFVYIDAMHDYDSVTNDIKYWISKIKSGGFIGGHDYLVGSGQGVEKAVKDYFGFEPKIYDDTSWIIKI